MSICSKANVQKQRPTDTQTDKHTNIGLTIPGNWPFKIRRISCVKSVWNPADFRFHLKSVRNPPDFTWNPYEIRRISWMWAFAWWSSIGLSFERPERQTCKTFTYLLSWAVKTRLDAEWILDILSLNRGCLFYNTKLLF